MLYLLIPLFLATTGQADPLDKILPWVTTVLGVVLGFVFKLQANASAERAKQAEDKVRSLRLETPVPEVPVAMRKIAGVPSWNDHSTLVERVARLENHIDRMRNEQAEQYRDILTSGANRQAEIVKQLSEKIDEVAVDWHRRLDQFFTKTPPRAR